MQEEHQHHEEHQGHLGGQVLVARVRTLVPGQTPGVPGRLLEVVQRVPPAPDVGPGQEAVDVGGPQDGVEPEELEGSFGLLAEADAEEVVRPEVELEEVEGDEEGEAAEDEERLEEADDKVLVDKAKVPPVAGVEQANGGHEVEDGDGGVGGDLLGDLEGGAQFAGERAGEVLQADDGAVVEVDAEEYLKVVQGRNSSNLDEYIVCMHGIRRVDHIHKVHV